MRTIFIMVPSLMPSLRQNAITFRPRNIRRGDAEGCIYFSKNWVSISRLPDFCLSALNYEMPRLGQGIIHLPRPIPPDALGG